MGKSKPRNRTKNRSDPVGKPVKAPADPELAALREKQILPCIRDLQSTDLKTRAAAASAISNIIEDTKCRKLLLREQIVRILLEQTLTDSSLETRTAGWGILRNLALEEEADFCIHLYRQDILTAIGGVVKSIIETLESSETPLTKLPAPHQALLWNLSTSIINLLSSLAESQEEIAEAICKQETLINFLFGLLFLDIVPDEVDTETLSCLTVLTEDNKPLVQRIVDNGDWLRSLIEIKGAGGIKAVSVCGVLHNVFTTMQWFDHNTPTPGASDAALVPVLVNSMKLAQAQITGTSGHTGNSSPDQILQLALEITASIATSLQEALEHGSGFEKEFEGFDDKIEEDEDDVMDAGDDELAELDEEIDDDEIDEAMEADMELVTGDAHDDKDSDEQPTLDYLVREAAPIILQSAQIVQDATPDKHAIQSHALSALNNIAWTVSSIDFSTGSLSSLQKFWSTLAQRIWDEIITPVLASNTADIELASSVTSLAWALARSRQGDIKIQPDEHRKFMALYQASKGLDEETSGKNGAGQDSDAFQGLGVKCIGVLGRLALDPAPVDLNREIGVFLLTILSALPDIPAADVVEVLDQLFDIYADKSFACDAVFWSDGFYKHLEDIQPKAKKLAKGIDKRKFAELRARADEALMNLGRFLKYKKTEKTA